MILSEVRMVEINNVLTFLSFHITRMHFTYMLFNMILIRIYIYIYHLVLMKINIRICRPLQPQNLTTTSLDQRGNYNNLEFNQFIQM